MWRCWTLWLLLEKISLQEQVWDDLCWSQSGNYLNIFSLQFFFWSSLKYIFIYVCSLQLERNGHNMSSPWGLSFLPLDWACQIVLICWTVTNHHEKRESRLVCHLIDRQTLISLSSLFCTQLVLLYMWSSCLNCSLYCRSLWRICHQELELSLSPTTDMRYCTRWSDSNTIHYLQKKNYQQSVVYDK